MKVLRNITQHAADIEVSILAVVFSVLLFLIAQIWNQLSDQPLGESVNKFLGKINRAENRRPSTRMGSTCGNPSRKMSEEKAIQVACPPSLLAEYINSVLLLFLSFTENRVHLLQPSEIHQWISSHPPGLQHQFRAAKAYSFVD